ncbi:hypothetical protein A7M79_07385 [Acinetobacter baumannii]|uniref:hypothetical protein n=1 Tax=Acinetobacter baumannii TaxID=470 RepID=UPI0008DE9B95|nr:hypothetical protein [Acinetobacter baumannii]OIH08629.1 hypothetical protein A7M79_07385 [Acinetobacter baumannii]
MYSFSELAISNMAANLVNVHFANDEAVSVSFNYPEFQLLFNGKLVARYYPVACNDLKEAKDQAKEILRTVIINITKEKNKQL